MGIRLELGWKGAKWGYGLKKGVESSPQDAISNILNQVNQNKIMSNRWQYGSAHFYQPSAFLLFLFIICLLQKFKYDSNF